MHAVRPSFCLLCHVRDVSIATVAASPVDTNSALLLMLLYQQRSASYMYIYIYIYIHNAYVYMYTYEHIACVNNPCAYMYIYVCTYICKYMYRLATIVLSQVSTDGGR